MPDDVSSIVFSYFSPVERYPMRVVRIIVAVSLMAASQAALAADKGGRFSVRGLGSVKCAELSSVIEKKDSAAIQLYSSWLAGYLSASNRLIAQTFDTVPAVGANEALGLVAVLCRSRKDTLVETVAAQSLEAMNSIRIREDSPLVTVQGSGSVLAVRQSAIIYAQTELAKLGMYKGRPEGKSDVAFVQAVRSFQKSQKLPETGLPDIDVLIRLKVQSEKTK